MNIFIKYCKKCKKPFDIGTNYDLCSECRKKYLIQMKGGNQRQDDRKNKSNY